jgi:hydrogenase maturation protein HypF
MMQAIVQDIQRGRSSPEIAMVFHMTLVQMMVDAACRLHSETGLAKVALSGGVFQNRLLLRLMSDALRNAEFQVLTHQKVPANDGGLSLGQAAIGATWLGLPS